MSLERDTAEATHRIYEFAKTVCLDADMQMDAVTTAAVDSMLAVLGTPEKVADSLRELAESLERDAHLYGLFFHGPNKPTVQ